MDLSLVEHTFPAIERAQLRKLACYGEELLRWNEDVNLISRKDTEHFVEHHLLHALAIQQCFPFPPGCRVLDVGTGGGLPGIPLAILNPSCQFTLVDSVEKKISVLRDINVKLGLKNILFRRTRVEELNKEYDRVLGRAVAALPTFIGWIKDRIRPEVPDGHPHGLIYLKGSLYKEECAALNIEPDMICEICDIIPLDYYREKYVLFFRRETLLAAQLPVVGKVKPGKKKGPKKPPQKSGGVRTTIKPSDQRLDQLIDS